MATEHSRLKLGKSASFVKSKLKRLPQTNETWEADFRAMPKRPEQTETHYLGVVVTLPHGDPLVYLPVEYNPNVNDLADLLAKALNHPLTDSAHRPERLLLRANPRWTELFPHLNEIGIDTAVQEELPAVEEVYEDFLRQMRKLNPGPIIMLSPGRRAEPYPAVADWVNGGFGHIEIGDQEGFGFVAKALDYGGLVFEDKKAKTLGEAMAALEKGLAAWFKEHCSDPPAAKRSTAVVHQRVQGGGDPGTVRIYTLAVFLPRRPLSKSFAKKKSGVSRTIQIRGDQTLEDLHHAIFTAFDRYDEHLYEFQLGKGPRDLEGPVFILEDVGDENVGGIVTETTIDSLHLKVGRSFGYLFDFGDGWQHQINVEAVEEVVAQEGYPKVIKRLGESPPQYPEEDE